MSFHNSDPDYLPLRRLVRQLRQESGQPQQALARKLGVSQSAMSNIETGKRRLDIVEAARVCEALGVSLTEFIARFEIARGVAPSGPPRPIAISVRVAWFAPRTAAAATSRTRRRRRARS